MEQLNGEDDQENKNADARNDEVSEQLSQWQYYNSMYQSICLSHDRYCNSNYTFTNRLIGNSF